jgi:crotonobetaine/carnitine-CoA ligase
MHPRYVEVVAELPKTPTARIRKFELRDQALTPATWDRDTQAFVTPS